MRSWIALCGVAACASFVASPAAAHWLYTKWGMTPEQAISASKGGLHAAQDDGPGRDVLGERLGAVGEAKVGRYTFKVSLYFDGSGLGIIHADPSPNDGGTCLRLFLELRAQYGQPAQFTGADLHPDIAIWFDHQKGNWVAYSANVTDEGCRLVYKPLNTDSGL